MKEKVISLQKSELDNFRTLVMDHYRCEGRIMAWRNTSEPWPILVSEVMLQQTPIARVEKKYGQWMARFPAPLDLAKASLAEVLEHWQGLGYPRRAKNLHTTAQLLAAMQEFPRNENALRVLPGIGVYTARAVMAFAFQIPVVLVETNIRAAIIHHFFPGEDSVAEKDIGRIVELFAHSLEPRTWYYALMDYGAMIKKKYGNPCIKSKTYRKQKSYIGSKRQTRGKILALLTMRGRADPASGSTIEYMSCELSLEGNSVAESLQELKQEGFVADISGHWFIHTG